jgi:hypothetical protein
MADIEKAIKIAKELDPSIGPSLDIDRKNMSEPQMIARLKKFFDDYDKAIQVVKTHPGQSYEQIKQTFDTNVKSHSRALIHVAALVNDVMGKNGDLNSLATSAARKIVLSDQRIKNFLQSNPKSDKAKVSQEIAETLEKNLINYFANLKGTELNKIAIIEELTNKSVLTVAEILEKFGKAA